MVCTLYHYVQHCIVPPEWLCSKYLPCFFGHFIHSSLHPLSMPICLVWGDRQLGPNPHSYWLKGGVHPGQVTSPLHGCHIPVCTEIHADRWFANLLITLLWIQPGSPGENQWKRWAYISIFVSVFLFLICLLYKCPLLSQPQLCCGKRLCITILHLPSLSVSNMSFHFRPCCSMPLREQSSAIPFPLIPTCLHTCSQCPHQLSCTYSCLQTLISCQTVYFATLTMEVQFMLLFACLSALFMDCLSLLTVCLLLNFALNLSHYKRHTRTVWQKHFNCLYISTLALLLDGWTMAGVSIVGILLQELHTSKSLLHYTSQYCSGSASHPAKHL